MSTSYSLPGFRDFYPEDCQLRNFIFNHWRAVCRRHNFQEYDSPVLQPTELFTDKSGAEIVGQLFNFTDKGERAVTLRPEVTPYVCHMVGSRAAALKRPLRWFSIAECFRYERPQKGRLRSFYQLNADIFDEAGTSAEAELISLAIDSFTAFGLTKEHFAIRLSDRTLWLGWLESQGMKQDQAYRVLQVVDKWERESPEEIRKKIEEIGTGQGAKLYTDLSQLMKIQSLEALQNFLSRHSSPQLQERLGQWQSLLADLTAMGYAEYIKVDLGIVRGLAYYTGFVFEVFERGGQGRALAGGGRYDDLIAKLGGPAMPAFGFGLGDVTLIELLKAQGLIPSFVASCDVYLAYTSTATRAHVLQMITPLRQAGFAVDMSLKEMPIGKQLKAADKAGAGSVIILGDDELARGIVKIKDLRTGQETEVPLAQVAQRLRSS